MDWGAGLPNSHHQWRTQTQNQGRTAGYRGGHVPSRPHPRYALGHHHQHHTGFPRPLQQQQHQGPPPPGYSGYPGYYPPPPPGYPGYPAGPPGYPHNNEGNHPHHPQHIQQRSYGGIAAAQQGFTLFVNDFGEESVEVDSPMRPRVLAPIGTKRDFNGEIPTFDVDERLLEDTRPIVDYTTEGDRTFRLFDDHMKCDLRSVYNVNDMNYWNPREICSKKVPRQSVQRWPVDVLGSNINEWKKSMVQFIGHCLTDGNNAGICSDGTGAGGVENTSVVAISKVHHVTAHAVVDSSTAIKNSSGKCEKNRKVKSSFVGALLGSKRSRTIMTLTGRGEEPVGAFGLVALSRLLYQEEGLNENPTGYVTFTGMNLHKLFKDIDKSELLTPTFAGPLADHNHVLDFGSIEAVRPFEEYNLPFQTDWPWHEIEKWRQSFRIKQPMLKTYTFETLMFIFYTISGETIQILAGRELHHRGWRFHKLFQVWLTPYTESTDMNGIDGNCNVLHNNPVLLGTDHQWQSGVYMYFNYLKWDFFKAEFKITPGVLTDDGL